jgi:chromosome segregation ATPase
MKKLFGFTVVCITLCFLSYGCNDASKARVGVVKDNILSQVDALLGEVQVKRKKVELSMASIGEGVDKLKKGKIEAKVRASKISEQLSEIEGKIADADKALGRLKGYLQDGKDVEISGKTFTQAQIKEMAEKTISARKSLTTQMEAQKQARERLETVATGLEARERESAERIDAFKRQLDEIDAKALALSSIKEASMIPGNDTSVDFKNLESEIRNLSTKVDIQLGYHDEKWKETSRLDDKDLIGSILSDTSSSSDTLDEIEKLIGK